MDASGDFSGCAESGNRFAFLEALSFFIDPEGAHGVMNSHADAGGPEGSTTSAPRMIKSYILNFLLGFWFGVACLRLYEQQGFLDIVTNLQDLEKSFLEFSRFLLPI